MKELRGGREEKVNQVYDIGKQKRLKAKYRRVLPDKVDSNIKELSLQIQAKKNVMQNSLAKIVRE